MRVARILLPSHSGFDRKCFDIDRAADTAGRETSWVLSGRGDADPETMPERDAGRQIRDFAPDILHVYGNGPVPHSLIIAAGSPWLSDRPLNASRPLLGRRPRERVRTLLDEVAEPVDAAYFTPSAPAVSYVRPTVGSLRRGPGVPSMRELTIARIQRFRDDVDWVLFDSPPSPESMRSLNLWVDPAADDDDLDGLVCEAIVAGVPAVASRTPINRLRTDDGNAAALCPKGDPNELAHAIVSVLFKEERAAALRVSAARIRETFRPERRHAALLSAYREVAR